MKNRLYLLIILGIVCAGFTYEFTIDFPFMAIVYGLVAVAAYLLRRRTKPKFRQIEGVVLFVAILAAYYAGPSLGPNRLIFIANALALYQLFRLFLPMDPRQEKFALAVGIVHLAVGGLAIVEPERFLPILALALYLVPSALAQIDRGQYRTVDPTRPVRQNRWQWVALVLLMVGFFLFFPRLPGARRLTPPAGVMGGGGQVPEEMDMDSPSDPGSDRLLFRVAGKDLGYLRIDSLDAFDGAKWRATNWSRQRDPDRSLSATPTPEMLFRKVKVFSRNVVGLALPTDRYPVGLQVRLRQHIYVADHGGVQTTHNVPANLTYEYWTQKESPTRDLRGTRHVVRYTNLTQYQPSPELQQWLDDLVRDEPTPYAAARRLEAHFQENYEYELGAPKLLADAPIEDFVLVQKRGHCGRYASAMAVLLRLRGIPSRVVRGFVPREYNDFGEFYNIRARDLHAWTEAWFPDRGWVAFDGTPYGSGVELTRRNPASSIYEWLEDNWYARIVEFSSEEQGAVMGWVAGAAGAAGNFVVRHMPLILSGLLFGAVVLLAAQFDWRRLLGRRGPRTRADVVREVRHFYAQLLRSLHRRRFRRRRHETPIEFARELAAQDHPEIEAIQLVTQVFCDVRYGEREISPATRAAVDQALSKVAACPAKGAPR